MNFTVSFMRTVKQVSYVSLLSTVILDDPE